MPDLISLARLAYLKIGVGSEISCMVNPKVCWVANTRTIWTHLVIKHADSIRKADEELKHYRQADVSSEMDYQMWTAIHAELRVALTRIAELGQENAKKSKITPGGITYIWADAIASALYEANHGEGKPRLDDRPTPSPMPHGERGLLSAMMASGRAARNRPGD